MNIVLFREDCLRKSLVYDILCDVVTKKSRYIRGAQILHDGQQW